MADRMGPGVRMELVCIGCRFVDARDDGVFCTHGKQPRRVGESALQTPTWCPLIHLAKRRAARLVGSIANINQNLRRLSRERRP